MPCKYWNSNLNTCNQDHKYCRTSQYTYKLCRKLNTDNQINDLQGYNPSCLNIVPTDDNNARIWLKYGNHSESLTKEMPKEKAVQLFNDYSDKYYSS